MPVLLLLHAQGKATPEIMQPIYLLRKTKHQATTSIDQSSQLPSSSFYVLIALRLALAFSRAETRRFAGMARFARFVSHFSLASMRSIACIAARPFLRRLTFLLTVIAFRKGFCSMRRRQRELTWTNFHGLGPGRCIARRLPSRV